jgi:hypothetical protein
MPHFVENIDFMSVLEPLADALSCAHGMISVSQAFPTAEQ